MTEFKRPPQQPDLEVELTLYSSELGGRKHALWQGCRMPHNFGLPDEMNDGMYEFQGSPPAPGASQHAWVWLLAPERNYGRLKPGLEYTVWDGRTIGTGRIIRVINAALSVVAQPTVQRDGP